MEAHRFNLKNPGMISCQCVTYGRVDLLEESIACFLNQDYEHRELVVLNTLPDQELVFNHPKVRIFNLKERPASLGDARNMCVEICRGSWITPWDDDNFFLPKQLSIFNRGMSPDNHWVKINRQFYSEKWDVKGIVQGEANLFAFTKESWRRVGGYPSVTVGEDQSMNNQIRAGFKGEIIHPNDDEITHVYGWGNGAYHASGKRKSEWNTAHERIAEWIQNQISSGEIPTGTIQLNPQIKHNIKRQCQQVIERIKKKDERSIDNGNLQHA